MGSHQVDAEQILRRLWQLISTKILNIHMAWNIYLACLEESTIEMFPRSWGDLSPTWRGEDSWGSYKEEDWDWNRQTMSVPHQRVDCFECLGAVICSKPLFYRLRIVQMKFSVIINLEKNIKNWTTRSILRCWVFNGGVLVLIFISIFCICYKQILCL